MNCNQDTRRTFCRKNIKTDKNILNKNAGEIPAFSYIFVKLYFF